MDGGSGGCDDDDTSLFINFTAVEIFQDCDDAVRVCQPCFGSIEKTKRKLALIDKLRPIVHGIVCASQELCVL